MVLVGEGGGRLTRLEVSSGILVYSSRYIDVSSVSYMFHSGFDDRLEVGTASFAVATFDLADRLRFLSFPPEKRDAKIGT